MSERVPPLTPVYTGASFAAYHQGTQAPFSPVVVRWDFGMSDEDEEFLDVPFNPAAQFPMGLQRVFEERPAPRQQPFLQRQLPAGWWASTG